MPSFFEENIPSNATPEIRQSYLDYHLRNSTYSLSSVKELVGLGANVNAYKTDIWDNYPLTVLDAAIIEGRNPDVVKFLIDKGAKIKQGPDNNGFKTILRALNSLEIAKIIFAVAEREDFIGTTRGGLTVKEVADKETPQLREALRETLQKHGLTDADLRGPKNPPAATVYKRRPPAGPKGP